MKELLKQRDFEILLSQEGIFWEKFRGKSILVTGATGLIGKVLIRSLLFANREKQLGIRIIALVRDKAKAIKEFGEKIDGESLDLLVGSVEQAVGIEEKVDYIIHGASPTASTYFASNPVETIQTVVRGTTNLLELAKQKRVEGFIYLSSMEVYGAPRSDEPIEESHSAELDTMSPRSCYPESKRLCETLCVSYCYEYGVPAKVIRLAQTFGPGINKNDNRVFAQFVRSILLQNDIVLKTTGESKRCYLDTRDAVSAILTVLISGKSGEAYNAANPETYCSIMEMAEYAAEKIANPRVRVMVRLDDQAKNYFSPTHSLNLKIDKLKQLGWRPSYQLKEMFENTLDGMK